MPIIEGFVAMGVVVILFWLIFIKISKNNPKAAETIKNLIPTNIYEKPKMPEVPDKIEQVWNERRTMM